MNLVDLRKRAGLSQPQMAARVGASKTWVSRVEAMYPDVMFPTLRRYLDALDVEVRFTADGIDFSSSDIEQDTSRNYVQGRKSDPTRAGKFEGRQRSATVSEDGPVEVLM